MRGEVPDRRSGHRSRPVLGFNSAMTRARSSGAGAAGDFSASSASSSRAGSSAPMIGRRTETMSSASVTGVAPCLIKLLVPSARGSSGEPGGKDFAALFQREPRRDQRARTFGRFDNDHAKGEARNQRLRKVSRPRSHPSGISVKANPVRRMSSRRSACSGDKRYPGRRRELRRFRLQGWRDAPRHRCRALGRIR